jgi:hypothetical protein
MQTPEEIAQALLNDPMGTIVPETFHRILVERIASALRAHGDARAAEERDKIIQYIKAEATKPEYGDGHEYWNVGALLDELADAIPANADQPGT